MINYEDEFKNFVASVRLDDVAEAKHRDRLERRLLGALAQRPPLHINALKAVLAARITRYVAAAVVVIAVLVAVHQFGRSSRVQLVGCTVKPVADAVYRVSGPRRIELEQGELFVDVDPSESKLTVETPAGTATALGTQFYVRTKQRKEQTMNKAKFITTVMVISGIVQLSNAYGSEKAAGGEVVAVTENSAPQRHVENLNAKFGKYYKKVEVTTKPSIPAYQLPLDLNKIVNLEKVSRNLGFKADEALIKKNGFMVVPYPYGRTDDIVKPYEDLKEAEIPIFVTADTLLHLYHVQFDESLKDIEEREFYDDILALTMTMQRESLRFYNNIFQGDTHKQHREAARLLVGYTTVALALLEDQSKASIPKFVEKEVSRELALIEAHKGFSKSPLFMYKEDYSQYVPRGHYTRSDKLKRYFKAMMWYGRMTFLLKGGEPHGPSAPYLVSAAEATRQTSAAALLTQQCICSPQKKLPDGRLFKEVLERIYTVTAFYVGLADDLGFEEYEYAIEQIPPGSVKLPIMYESSHDVLRRELAKLQQPAIYSGTGGQETAGTASQPEELVKALDKSTGFRLMGQRFIPDSYVMGQLVFPTVGNPNRQDMFTYVKTFGGGIRGFPRGLDVMALLGSSRARELLAELGDDDYGSNETGTNIKYDVVFNRLKDEFDALSESDWNRNIYWSWLHALKPFLNDLGAGYPTFMTTQGWRDKSMTTALASWAQLRHDTILYSKQSYTMRKRTGVGVGGGVRRKPVEGYVEPVPEFYARMLALTRMTLKGLNEMNVLTPLAIERLKGLDEIIARLLEISEKELAHQELSRQDYAFIRNFGEKLEKSAHNSPNRRNARTKDSMKTTLIADVHTDQNSGKVLEEGTGYVDMIVVCYLQPDGRLVLGAGPVLSYYEFKHPMQDRLTDEKWRQLLQAPDAPSRPVWVENFLRK